MDKLTIALLVVIIAVIGAAVAGHYYGGERLELQKQTQLKIQNQTQYMNQTQTRYRNQTQNCSHYEQITKNINPLRYQDQNMFNGELIQHQEQNRNRIQNKP